MLKIINAQGKLERKFSSDRHKDMLQVFLIAGCDLWIAVVLLHVFTLAQSRDLENWCYFFPSFQHFLRFNSVLHGKANANFPDMSHFLCWSLNFSKLRECRTPLEFIQWHSCVSPCCLIDCCYLNVLVILKLLLCGDNFFCDCDY